MSDKEQRSGNDPLHLPTSKTDGTSKFGPEHSSELATEDHLQRLSRHKDRRGLQQQVYAPERHSDSANTQSGYLTREPGDDFFRLEPTSTQHGKEFDPHHQPADDAGGRAVGEHTFSQTTFTAAWLERHPGWEVTKTIPAIPAFTIEKKPHILLCDKCKIMGTKLECSGHQFATIPLAIFKEIFSNIKYEVRLTPEGSTIVKFFLVRTPESERKLRLLGEYFDSGQGTIPGGEWAVSYTEIPFAEHLIELLKGAVEIQDNSEKLSLDMRKYRLSEGERVLMICPTREVLGVDLACACKHVAVGEGIFNKILGHLQWVCWYGDNAQFHVNFRNGDEQESTSLEDWASNFGNSTIYGEGVIPPGQWEKKISKLPDALTTLVSITKVIDDLFIVKEVFEASTEKGEVFYSVASRLEEELTLEDLEVSGAMGPKMTPIDQAEAKEQLLDVSSHTEAHVAQQEKVDIQKQNIPFTSTPTNTRVLRSHVRKLIEQDALFRPTNPVACTLQKKEEPK